MLTVLLKIVLNNQEVTIDNAHVVAWSQTIDYSIHLENGFWQSIGTGEEIGRAHV